MSRVMALGNLRARARRAGTGAAGGNEGMGPKPWATYPAWGGPNQTLEAPYGSGPQWRNNFITNPVVTPQEPQNLQRVFNGGVPFSQNPTGASAGKPIIGLLSGLGRPPQLVNPATKQTSFTMGLGRLNNLGRLGALGVDDTLALERMVAEDPQLLAPCMQGTWMGGTFYTVADLWKWRSVWLSISGLAIGAYHGYHRNKKSVGWSIGWGTLGWLFPVIVTGTALVQGVGKPK